MATLSSCKINKVHSIKKINQDHLLNGHISERNYSVLISTPHSGPQPFTSYRWTQRCSEKANTNLLSSKQDQHRRNGSSLKYAVTEQINVPFEEEIGKEEEEEEEEISRKTLIWRAIKLPMYTVALIPVTVGSAAAYWQTGFFSTRRYFMILASFVLVNAWLNLSNDVYDFDTGADTNKKESVVNLFGNRTVINIIAWLLLVLGFVGLTLVAVQARSPRSILLVASAIFGFYLYQCPPFRLSYYGVGEPLLFLSFGPFSTIAFYLLHSIKSELPISGTIVWSSILVGLTTSLILFCSHFHQIEDDKAVGKISPLVRLGTETGSKVVKWAVIGLYSLLLALGVTQTLPFASVILCAMTLPMGNLVVSFVEKNHKDKTKIFMGKYFCVRLHTIFGAALAAGLLATKQLPQGIMMI